MSILKLTEAGDEMTLEIASAEIVPGNFGQQAKFVDKHGDTLFVPLSSVERQLDRCGVGTVEELTGRAIHFSRAASNKPGGKPFWNMDKARDGDVVHKGNGKVPETATSRLAAQSNYKDGPLPNEDPREYMQETGAPPAGYEQSESGFSALVERYGECFSEALAFAQRVHKLGIPTDASAVSSIAATLMIARKDARC